MYLSVDRSIYRSIYLYRYWCNAPSLRRGILATEKRLDSCVWIGAALLFRSFLDLGVSWAAAVVFCFFAFETPSATAGLLLVRLVGEELLAKSPVNGQVQVMTYPTLSSCHILAAAASFDESGAGASTKSGASISGAPKKTSSGGSGQSVPEQTWVWPQSYPAGCQNK